MISAADGEWIRGIVLRNWFTALNAVLRHRIL